MGKVLTGEQKKNISINTNNIRSANVKGNLVLKICQRMAFHRTFVMKNTDESHLIRGCNGLKNVRPAVPFERTDILTGFAINCLKSITVRTH